MKKKPKTRNPESKLPMGQDSKSSPAVGYGRPPIHTRFASGKSGNPRGRPKGHLNLETELRNELNRVITVREGDQNRRLKKGVAWLVRVINGALNNDPKANSTLVALLRAFTPVERPEAAVETPLTTDDKGVVAEFLQRHSNSDDHGNDHTDPPSSTKRLGQPENQT